MKSVLVVLALVVAGVVGLGFYLGWFHLSSGNSANDAHVTVSMDKGQMQEDKDRAVDQVQDLGQPAKEEVATAPQKAQE